MSKKYTKRWFKAAFVRAVNTIIQCFLAMYLMKSLLVDVSYIYMICASLTAGVYSIFISSFGLPESRTDGALLIDTHDPNKDVFRLSLDTDLSELPKKKQIVLVVDSKADLSQEKPVL